MQTDIYQFGYDKHLIKISEYPVLPTEEDTNNSSLSAGLDGLGNTILTPSEIATAIPSGSVNYAQTTFDTFKKNEDMQSSGFISGTAGSGWRIKGNGDVEFNNGVFMGALSAATIDIGGSDATSFHVDINGNMWLGAATFSITTNPFAVSNAGTIRAVSGNIAGWNLADGYIYNLQSGTPTAVPSDGIVMASGNEAILCYEDTAKRLELGYLAAGIYGLKVYDTGGSNVMLELSDTQQVLSGWVITSGYLYSLASGTPTAAPNDGLVLASTNPVISIYEDTAKRCELGYLSAGVYGLKGYDTGGSNVIFELSDTQQKLAGWYFDTTSLADNTTAANAKIYIDSANTLIRAGATTGDYLTMDGANLRIRSSNYVSGFAGAGFTLEPDLLEVGNIAARGLIRSSVMEYNNISVHSGSNIIAFGGDVLAVDMTAADASVFTIKGTDTFAVNDILRIKDGINDEWLKVTGTGSAPTYTVTRDQANAYGADANPAWKLGASVTNYGPSGSGLIYMTASDTNAPYLSVATHAGSPWTTITTQLRLGNLNGYLGYVADIYGFGAGSSSGTNANVTIETTNGIRLRNGTTNAITLDNSGVITVGAVGAGLANTYISAGTLSIRLNTTALFGVDTSGNVLVGQTGVSQSNAYLTAGTLYLRNNVTNKIVLNADGTAYFAGALTIGDGTTISGTLTLNHFNTGGDTYIAGGTITVANFNAQGGFIMGIDDSDTDYVKFYLGDSTTNKYVSYDEGTGDLTINGQVNGLFGFGGDGSDGALTVAAGTTTLNLDQIYNFSSITISAGATLTFTGTGMGVLNCSGNCSIAGTIELRQLVTSQLTRATRRDNFLTGDGFSWTASVGGATNIGGLGGNGGAGGTSTDASGTPGVGGAGGVGAAGAGTAGSGGNSSVGGGGGGGGADQGGTAGTVGATTVTVNGANGGAGGAGGAPWSGQGGAGGSGGGGLTTGNGGNGAVGGAGAGPGGYGGHGGASGATAGNGGTGGAGGSSGGSGIAGAGANGGNGGAGYVNGGNGGNGGNGSAAASTGAGAGGSGGTGFTGTGGVGGTGGIGGAVVTGGTGGSGGRGYTGGAGGVGGGGSGGGSPGQGGAGGRGTIGSTAFVLYCFGTLDLNGMVINAQAGTGGNGGAGGVGGSGNSNGGAGGAGGDGADIVMLSIGTLSGTYTVNNVGGAGGSGGVGQGTGSKGAAGATGVTGSRIITKVFQT